MRRLVSADEVKEIICKYENRIIQRTMIYEIEKLNGCLATEEQMLEILGNKDINLEQRCKSMKKHEFFFQKA